MKSLNIYRLVTALAVVVTACVHPATVRPAPQADSSQLSNEGTVHTGETGQVGGDLSTREVPKVAWRAAFELSDSERFFATVVARDQGWVAAGKEVVVVGGDKESPTPTVEILPSRLIQTLAEVDGGRLFAVGNAELIMTLDAKSATWRLHHHDATSPNRGRRFSDVLNVVGIVIDGDAERLMAWGPTAVLAEAKGGKWMKPKGLEVGRLHSLALFGPPQGLSCSPRIWRWYERGLGWYVCAGGATFLWSRTGTAALPALDAECSESISVASANRFGMALHCGDKVALLLSGERAWKYAPPPAPDDLRAVSLSSHRALAVTASTLWIHDL